MLVWVPTEQSVKETALYALMQEQGIASYDAIHTWSVQNPAAFVERTVKCLNIKFQQPYSSVLDITNGAHHAQWFTGARMNIAESCFKNTPSRTAIITRRHNGTTETVTEAALEALSNRVANGLVAMGLTKGDAVAIDMPMTVEAVAAYLSIVKAGMVVISIPDSLPPEQIAVRLQIGDAKAVFTQSEIVREDKRLPLYQKVCAAEASAPRAIVILPHGETNAPTLRAGDVLWNDFLSPTTTFTAVGCNPHDATNIIFSSGTTGTPKAIPWDHTTPIKSASDALYHHNVHAGDLFCWPTNLGWMMGPWLLYATLINNGTVALYEGAPGERGFCEFVQDAKVTLLGLVPSIAVGWRNAGKANGLDWSAVRAFSSSGEASNPEVYSWLMTLGQPAGVLKPVIEYCGGTETGGSYISGNLVRPLGASQFNGKAMGLDFAVLDSNGNPCGVGDTGEVFLVPPAIGLSTRLHKGDNDAVYYKDVPAGLRKHGDLMTLLPDGYYKSNGRAGNDMNLGGIKVGSPEIEQVVNTVPGVLETAAIGVPAPDGGPDRLVIYTVMRDTVKPADVDVAALKDQMRAVIKTALNPLFHVHDVVLIESLPRTASNKVMHRELRSAYASR